VTAAHRKRMGCLNPAACERTADELMASGDAPEAAGPDALHSLT